MKDTFTLADLANFKLPQPEAKVEPQSAAPATQVDPQPAESSAATAAPSDEIVESSDGVTAPIAADDSAPAVDDTTPVDQTAATEPQAKSSGKKSAREFINELAEERDALRRFNEYLLAQNQAPVPEVAPTPVPGAEVLPTLEACGFDVAKYEEAMKAYTTKQVEAAKTQGAQTATENAAKAAFEQRLAAYTKANPSVVTVLGNPHLRPLSPEAALMVMESELGPQILHRFGSNPDEAVRITRQSPAKQAAAIGRIEGELRAKAIKPPKTPTPNITRAPSPPTPTQGRGNTPSVDPMKLSTKEWIAWDRQQTLEKRRAAKGARSA